MKSPTPLCGVPVFGGTIAMWGPRLYSVNTTVFRSVFQFFAVTLGSSVFNCINGILKFAYSIKLLKSGQRKQVLALILIIITSFFTFLHSMATVQNHIMNYLLARSTYLELGDDWERFNFWFFYHYKVNFFNATILMTIILFCLKYILQTSMVLGKNSF